MNKIICSLTVVVALLFTACNDYLDIAPTTQVASESALGTYADLEVAINGVYYQFANNALMSGNARAYGDILGDFVFMTGNTDRQIYNRTTANQGFAVWERFYRTISGANSIIDAIENNKTSYTEKEKANVDRILGEAYFLRGVSYFEMVRLYALPWGHTSDNSQPGVIIKTKPTVSSFENQARNSVAEVYDLLIKDLTKASTLLPSAYDIKTQPPSYMGRATAFAAKAYLGRVYFQQADYVKAKAAIDQVIGATPGTVENFPLNTDVLQAYRTAGFTTNSININKESVFLQIHVLGASFSSSMSGKWYSAKAGTAPNNVASKSFVATAKFWKADKRNKWIDTVRVNKVLYTFTRKYDGISPTDQNFNIPVIRSAELILDRAEINALANNANAALADVNVIRKRAGITEIPQGSISASAVLDTVRLERVRELCFDGDRLHDLRRLKADVGPGDRPGYTAVPFNHWSLLLKIPTGEIANNPLCIDNPDQ